MADILVNSSGKLSFNGKEYRCAIGPSGVIKDKKDGDGGTPEGCFPLRRVFYRADKISKPETVLPCVPISKDDGWCDDSKDPNYNTFVKLPYAGGREELWREDNLYDLVAVIGYNDAPPVPGKGSAIFMHVARESYSPTAGCVALALNDLIEILKGLAPDSKICISR